MSKISDKRSDITPDIFELLPVREYRCEFDCGKVFKNRNPYELHLQRKHGIDIQENVFHSYRCPIENCVYFGSRLNLVRRHYQTHHMEKMFNCDECSRRFLTESQYVKHRCEVQTYSCQRCPRTFKLLSARNRHVKQCVKKTQPPTPHVEESLDNDQTQISSPDTDPYITEILNAEANDDVTIEEFEQLIRNVENNTVKDPALLEELAALTPVLESLQS